MRLPLLAALLATVSPMPLLAQQPTTDPTPETDQAMDDNDPYIWLEEFSSPRALEWVQTHNAQTVSRLTADPHYQGFYDDALAIAGAKDRIPQPSFLHGEIFNFWQDETHLRGIWRKTSLADYRTDSPSWTTVLDIDALGKAEGKSWVLKGIDCLEPEERRCLISLSDGGEDAVEIREFDLDNGTFIADGFQLPRGKHRIAWEDADHLLVATNLLSFSFLTNAVGMVLPKPLIAPWFLLLVFWTPINLFQTLRGGYGSSILGALLKSSIVWIMSFTAFAILVVGLMIFTLYQM